MIATAEDIRVALRCGAPRCPCTRARGPWHCPAHDDRRPSFAVTERDGRVLVNCRAGCSQADVIAALRARGLWAGSATPKPRAPRSLRDEVRSEVLARERAAEARRAPYRAMWAAADEYRQTMRAVTAARAIATTAGPDGPEVWDVLALAAAAETRAEAALAEARP